MSRWSDEFESHPIHELLNQAVEYLETEVEDIDAEFEEELRRLKKIFGNLREIVQGSDSEFFLKALLDQINGHFQQHVLPQLQAFSENSAVAQLRTANDRVTSFAPQIHQLAAMSRPMESQEVISQAEKAFGSFAASMENTANETSEQFTKHEAELLAFSEKVEALEQQLAELNTTSNDKLTEWQDDFTEKQTTRVEEHSDAQIERDTKFEELMLEWKTDIEAQRTDIEKVQLDKLQGTLDQFTKEGVAVLKDVKEKHEEVKEIHKLVGRDSVAGGYQTSAGEEKKQANFWRVVSMFCLAGTVIWLVVKYKSGFVPTGDGGVNWPDVITASSLTGILIYAASYTSRQSKMHRENEKLLRSYALETKALDPFIASLEKEEQQAIKAELVRRMFGQQNAESSGKSAKREADTEKTLLDRLKPNSPL